VCSYFQIVSFVIESVLTLFFLCRSMDCYLTLPINDYKLQELVDDAKDFVYGLGNLVIRF